VIAARRFRTRRDAITTGQLPEHGLALARDVVRLAEASDRSLNNGGAQVEIGDEMVELVG
jgi:hypothetical protein